MELRSDDPAKDGRYKKIALDEKKADDFFLGVFLRGHEEAPTRVSSSPGRSREEYPAQTLYEDHYCEREEMENRIKEQQLELFADRTSTHYLKSNQVPPKAKWHAAFIKSCMICSFLAADILR